MPFTRTIYTQGALSISGVDIPLLFVTGVQSANFDGSSPKQDVNQFGLLGSINKVQLEAATAKMDVSCIISMSNTGFLSVLMDSSMSSNPTYYDFTVSGIGKIQSGLLSAFSIEAAMGSLPKLNMTFEGQSGAFPTAASAPIVPNSNTATVIAPSDVSGILWSGGTSTCAQSIRLNWEMPVDRLNCLGANINLPTVFTRPPGNMTFTIEGLSQPTIVTGLIIGPYAFSFVSPRIVSRVHNMAIGDSAASYSLTQEGTAFNISLNESFYYIGNEGGNILATEGGDLLILG